MNILCPSCDFEFPGDVDEVVQCPRCNHAMDDGSEDPAELEPNGRPDWIKASCRITPEELSIVVPPIGWRLITWFFLVFTSFWNVLTWTFLVNALSLSDLAGMLFLIPFLLVGVLTAGIFLFVLKAESVLLMDAHTVSLSYFIFGKSFTRVREIEHMKSVERVQCYSINSVPTYGIGLAFSKGWPLRFGSALDDEELHSLMSKIRRFWKAR